MLVLALSPSSYANGMRHRLAQHIHADSAPSLLWFTLLCALVSLVLTRIVVVTAQSYGLTQYAMEMVVRTLVLELIPLTAALFVALRCTIANGAAVSRMRRTGTFEAMRARGIDVLQTELLPRVVSGVFATVLLVMLSCVVAVLLSYGVVHGLSSAGLAGYTRMFGNVFSPVVTLLFVAKTMLFSAAVAVIPMANGAHELTDAGSRTQADLTGLVRLFSVLVGIEMLSLMGNYY